ncbi:MAG: hypothetical protein KBT03_11950 [Bacteroidales bacterium]|nr:hypothetical protein [Candidatus Scybalousia scybalohippi]
MFGGNNAPFQMPVMPAYGGYGNGNNGLGDDWIALIILAAIFGWGGFGFGGGFGGFGGAGAAGAIDNYVLASDFSQLARQIDTGFAGVEKGVDSIRNGLCDGFYTQAQLINGVNMNIAQNGYESRLATQTLGAQMAQCCCDARQQIGDVNYNLATQANGIGRQIERGFADTNYNMATQNCATLQAIDKVGDRVIDYLANQETQKLRDQIAEYRDREGRQYVINELNKCPIPAYLTCNPNAPLNYNVTYGNGCGCA